MPPQAGREALSSLPKLEMISRAGAAGLGRLGAEAGMFAGIGRFPSSMPDEAGNDG